MLDKARYKPRYFKFSRGFTLIETIVGIVALSIAFTIFTSLIYPLANQSAEQVHQIRAAELGQSMINEILGKAFDENSDMSGGRYRCGEDQNNDGSIEVVDGETCSVVLGNEESGKRELFDDVDDYHGLTGIESSLGADDSLNNTYLGYGVSVTVINDSNYDDNPDDSSSNATATAKLITVTITSPQDTEYVFSVYKVNY